MKKLILALGILMGSFGASQATDISNMNAEESAAFGEAVRSYLVQNPTVILEVIAELERQQAQQQVSSDQHLIAANYADLFEDANSYVGGNPDGDVVVVEFLDYKCSFCKKSHPEVEQLLKEDGNIRFIIKEFPILGDESMLASRYAVSVLRLGGPEIYKEVSDTLMEFRGRITDSGIAKMSETYGLNHDDVLADMNSETVDDIIAANHSLASRMQITGTPGFVFNNQMVRGYMPLDQMEALVAALRQ